MPIWKSGDEAGLTRWIWRSSAHGQHVKPLNWMRYWSWALRHAHICVQDVKENPTDRSRCGSCWDALVVPPDSQNKIQASIEPWLPWVAPLFPPAPYSLLRPWNVPALVHLWACAWAVPLLSLGTSVTLGRVVSFPAFAPPFSRHVLWCRPSLWDSASLPVTLTQRALVRWSLC